MRKIIRIAIIAVLLFALFVAPVYAQGDIPTPPEGLTPLTAWILLATIILPPLNSLIKRGLCNASKEVQSAAIFVACVLVAVGQAFFNGSLKWANGDPGTLASIMVINIAVVLVLAFAWYKYMWQGMGIDSKITGNK